MKKINSFKDLVNFIKLDFKAQDRKLTLKELIFSPLARFTILLRINEYLSDKNIIIRFLPLFLYKKNTIRLGLSIPFNVCNYGLNIVHYGLTIISPDAIIGKNCRIHAGVNIGGSAGF